MLLLLVIGIVIWVFVVLTTVAVCMQAGRADREPSVAPRSRVAENRVLRPVA